MNHLLRMTLIDAPFSSVIEYVVDFFEEQPHLRVKAIASTTVPVETRIEVVDDRADKARHHEAVALSWKPPLSIFPRFEGLVSVRPHFSGAILSVEGTYAPPGRAFGRIFDEFIGKRLACATMDHLLRRIRIYGEMRYRAFQQSSPTVEELNERNNVYGAS